MDQNRWDTILGKINAPRSRWILLSKKLKGAKTNFTIGHGATGAEVRDLKKTWRSDYPFIDENGNPFVLFIYDQASSSWYKNKEYKYHFCWCSTIETMTAGGRGARYKSKEDVSDNWFLVNKGTGSDVRIQMNVCKKCLSHMNYRGWNSAYYKVKDQIYNEFDIEEFFKKNVPQNLLKPTHQFSTGNYTPDFSEISRKTKEQRGSKCEECNSTDRLQTHHINGVKDDNRPSNLKVLCCDCHTEQLFHSHMKKSSANFNKQNKGVQYSKKIPVGTISKSQRNKLENFMKQPERYATGSEKAIQKVRDARHSFGLIRDELSQGKQDDFFEAMRLYESKLKNLR